MNNINKNNDSSDDEYLELEKTYIVPTIIRDNVNDEMIFNPYNPLNKEIKIHEIQELLNRYNLNIKPYNIKLYLRAFVHKSYTKRPKIENDNDNITLIECPENCLPLKTKSNERLEFIGDGVLELITKYYLYKRFPKADEGFMTEKKIAIVKNEHIGRLAYEMGLHKYIIISKHAEEKNIRTNLKKLGCLFEAFIGAIFLDFNKIDIDDEYGWFKNVFTSGPGFLMAQIFVENILETHVDWLNLIQNDDNYKNRLQVIIQKEFKITPDYVELITPKNYEYDETDKLYKMGLYICIGQYIKNVNIHTALDITSFNSFKFIHEKIAQDNKILVFLSSAEHKIKKKAEQLACLNAINILEKFI